VKQLFTFYKDTDCFADEAFHLVKSHLLKQKIQIGQSYNLHEQLDLTFEKFGATIVNATESEKKMYGGAQMKLQPYFSELANNFICRKNKYPLTR
jgi:hypothetical protein